MQSQGAAFADLPAEKRDAVLMSLPQNLQPFFNQARTYTLQGTFGDPHYGGNTNGKGWDIIRYPGPRPATTADMQRMDKPAEAYRRSAWGTQ
jgi:gluconate 2-dehydrogenase gamma chain